MTSARPASIALRPLRASRPSCLLCPTTFHIQPTNHQRIQPFSNPFLPAVQTLTATRTLPYSSRKVYSIISDVSSYQHFLPFVTESIVTKYSKVDNNGHSWPEEAKLAIGFSKGVSETFWSRLYCVPETIVEAVSGETETSLSADAITHHSQRPPSGEDPARTNTVLSHLSARWTLRPFPYKPPPTSATHPDTTHKNHDETNPIPAQAKTEINLSIEYQFANPFYAGLSAAVAPKVADKMIEAFEKRMQAVYDGEPEGRQQTKGVMRPRGQTP